MTENEEVEIPCILRLLKLPHLDGEGHEYFFNYSFNDGAGVFSGCPNKAELDILFKFGEDKE